MCLSRNSVGCWSVVAVVAVVLVIVVVNKLAL